ncbi:exodeoxyribonuclease V subunit alpha [Buchnera aphidicola (Hyadaphis tataricae)]|uniref:RecBCD enzyme subunit RecD n=1 Tax=Buchnera aphidicola (Hyadaphis tataricae) TaxID=1241859 RepID=A0A4D6Y6F7_9GAMM|nr:exodeoxyribonuclease V subunit alpha [Buchnera aphidicola]QCI21888.1 exodeoxyribonuclease V subunit alpha [Buchnera aphidicola (Hyadaphis tataricae)]
MLILMQQALQKKIIHPIDFYFAQFISKKSNILMLVSTCMSYEYRNGYSFLKIEYFQKKLFFNIFQDKYFQKISVLLDKKINWEAELLRHESIGNGDVCTPLVYFKKKIYLYKIWKAEGNILKYLYNKKSFYSIKKNFSVILDNLFPKKTKHNMQKIAVALTLINQITFITGAPGTGKTTIILKIMIALIKTAKKPIKIQLCATTGKATTHLNEMMNNNIFHLYLSEKEKNNIPYNALTIHSLLGIQKISQKNFFHKNNKLNIDVLIIDESSMIDILTMEKIFFSVMNTTKLIFIGDHNQLKPIETGDILKNICFYSKYEYSSKLLFHIKKLTNYTSQKKHINNKAHFINDKICVLKKSYRFNQSSGIYILSQAIHKKDIKIIKKMFNNKIKDVCFKEIHSTDQYNNMIKNITDNYKIFWETIHKTNDMQLIIKTFQKYQVLCFLKEGIFGVNILNQQLEYSMYKKKLIKYIDFGKTSWYVGKPIMITNNNKSLNLFNGNIGITNINNDGLIQVSFLKDNNRIHNVPVSILKNYETAWVTTVHKAQGSEFINTTLILPNYVSPISNKDILYTGITRSQKKLSIFSTKKIFKNTLFNKTYYTNGITDRIQDFI